jgi:hypothetical protein
MIPKKLINFEGDYTDFKCKKIDFIRLYKIGWYIYRIIHYEKYHHIFVSKIPTNFYTEENNISFY